MKEQTKKRMVSIGLAAVMAAAIAVGLTAAWRNEISSSGVIETATTAPVSMGTPVTLSLAKAGEVGDYKEITVNVHPDSAVDKTVTIRSSWVNASSAWASGKKVENYLEIKSVGTEGNVFRIRALQPFSEKIELKAISRANPSALAEPTIVDYAKRLEDVVVFGQIIEASKDPEYGGMYEISHDETSNVVDGVSIMPVYAADSGIIPNWGDRADITYIYSSEGTVNGSMVDTKLEIKATDEYLKVYPQGRDCYYKDWVGGSISSERNRFCYSEFLSGFAWGFLPFQGTHGAINVNGYNHFLEAISTYDAPDFIVRVTVTMRYGDTQEDKVIEFPCEFDRTASVFKVVSTSFSQGNVVL